MTWPYYYFPRSRKRKKNAVILEGQHCYGLQMLKAAGRLGGLSFHRYFSNNILEKFGSSKIFHEIICKDIFFFQNVYLCSKRHIVKKYKPHPCVIYKTLTTPQENCVTFWPFFRKKRTLLIVYMMQIAVLSHLIVKFTNNTNSILNAPAPYLTVLPGGHP